MNASCYLCKSGNLKVVRNKLRHDIRRDVLGCPDCGLVYLAPAKIDLREYYADSYRKLYSPIIGKSLTSRETFEIYHPLQNARLNDLKHLLNEDARVLDVGCSAGQFLYAVKDSVRECVGIEFNRNDADFVNHELGIKTYSEPITSTDLPSNYFDVITALQVLEHVDDPISFLSALRPYLRVGGHLVIEVPNIQDALLSVYKVEAYADFWYREPHTFYYSPKTLTAMLRTSGFNGSTKTLQRYNVLNQMNWIFRSTPQATVEIGMTAPTLVNGSKDALHEEMNEWIRKVDQEYRQMLTRHDLGDCIMFTGQRME